MRTRVLLAGLLVVAAALLWAGWVVTSSYLLAPRLVAEVDRTGVLSFSPSELPRSHLCALMVVQDRMFFRHQGIGFNDGPLGHTTITQAVGKWLFFKAFNPGPLHYRKIRLMLAAWGFDRRISKDTQLRLFLNRAFFGSMDGREILGFPAAAYAFYGKTLTQLSDIEFLSLLVMLEGPNRYHVVHQPRQNAERIAAIQMRVQQACRDGCFEGSSPVPCQTQGAPN